MENISYGLKFAIGIVITLLIIGFGVGIYFVADALFGKAQDNTTSQTTALTRLEYSKYDNKGVTGQEVINAAIQYENRPQFSINIKTGILSGGFYAENNFETCYDIPTSSEPLVDLDTHACKTSNGTNATADISALQDTSNNFYVNPTGIFTSQIYRDGNNEVRIIEFIQE
ncbi:hypothetical protein [Longirhabdus pacifica]|uniref:hypothetical protein n=1 Tax=Longirhabdus pacifica TaxID=2305227 RepID=UPI00100869FC|nr:hypothetical protein [Longirhabdus pacifica]